MTRPTGSGTCRAGSIARYRSSGPGRASGRRASQPDVVAVRASSPGRTWPRASRRMPAAGGWQRGSVEGMGGRALEVVCFEDPSSSPRDAPGGRCRGRETPRRPQRTSRRATPDRRDQAVAHLVGSLPADIDVDEVGEGHHVRDQLIAQDRIEALADGSESEQPENATLGHGVGPPLSHAGLDVAESCGEATWRGEDAPVSATAGSAPTCRTTRSARSASRACIDRRTGCRSRGRAGTGVSHCRSPGAGCS